MQNVHGEQGQMSSVGHNVGVPSGMYAHQYPHASVYGPVGYQYPPSPPPVPGTPTAYSGGANYPPGLLYNNIPPQPLSGNGTGIASPIATGSGYATPTAPTPRGPPPHNAFIANSAIARSSSAVDLVPYAARFNGIGHTGHAAQSRRSSVDVAGVSLVFAFAFTVPPLPLSLFPIPHSSTSTDLSHLRTSCVAKSSISGNMSRMAAVPNAGMSRRSDQRYVSETLRGLCKTHTSCGPVGLVSVSLAKNA